MLSTLLRLFMSLVCLSLICLGGERLEKQRFSLLIIDGVNNHDWQTGTRAVKAILTSTGRFTVEVSTTPPREAPKEAWDSWRPQFSKYHAVLINFNGGHKDDGVRWPADVERALEQYVRAGGGLIILH